jgi:hypothetical protein
MRMMGRHRRCCFELHPKDAARLNCSGLPRIKAVYMIEKQLLGKLERQD